MVLLLEEKNHMGRPFGADEFYAIVEKLIGCDTCPDVLAADVKKV